MKLASARLKRRPQTQKANALMKRQAKFKSEPKNNTARNAKSKEIVKTKESENKPTPENITQKLAPGHKSKSVKKKTQRGAKKKKENEKEKPLKLSAEKKLA